MITAKERKSKLDRIRSVRPLDSCERFLLSEIDRRDLALRIAWNHRSSIFNSEEPAAALVISEIGEALGEA